MAYCSDREDPYVGLGNPNCTRGETRRINSYLRRLQVDCKQSSKTESCPLPRAEDILSSLAGRKLFTTLNLAHTYNQIPLDKLSQKLVVLNTPKGLYKKRLPFGVEF